jgi:hypothetical protein
MKSNNLWGRIVAVAALLLLVSGGAAFAQLQSGNLYGTVTDDQGATLPGVSVSLTGSGAPQVQVTDAQGRFRFLGLGPGTYALKAELEGFSTIEYPNIVINIGRNTEINVTLSAAVEDVITVTAESPLLDERRISTGATVSQTELEKIPTSRDPWAVLQTTPGVLTDRINVGGNESGQQSQYIGPGSGGDQAIWAVDGVVITDMAALGSSPAYYDFDSFEEMQVTTGGSDTTIATGGVVLNMVTKRGTNEWRGTGRYLLTDQDWQSDTDVDSVDFPAAQPAFTQGNRIVDVKDFGAELGGPIVRDRLWIWGSYGKQEVDLLTAPAPPRFPNGVSDFTELETMNLKLNAQIAANNSATLFALNSDKVKLGRNAGPTRPQETTWNQSKFGDDPTAAKLEDTHIFSSNFYLTGLYSIVNGGFQLAPQGGLGPTPFQDDLGVWNNSFRLYQTERPQEQYKLDASNFFNTGTLSHELKFGASLREAEVTSVTVWPGNGYIQHGDLFGFNDLTDPDNLGLRQFLFEVYGIPVTDTIHLLNVSRDGGPSIKQDYTSAYVQDTLTFGNLTANIGLRYDLQEGVNLDRTVAANPLVPNALPAVSYQGGDIGFEWESITPRLGLTYALGAERKTLLRASYSQFADQLGTGYGSWLNPIGYNSYGYWFTRSTGPNVTTADLYNTTTPEFGFSANVNPFTGGLFLSNGLDSDLDAPMTDELLLSVEHALLPEFVVGLNLTYRRMTDLLEGELLVFDSEDPFSETNLQQIGRPHRRDDYIRCGTPGAPACAVSQRSDGTPTLAEFWVLRPGVSTRNGSFLENGDREQEYQGASLVFNKRLANRWMLRGNVTWSDWTWSEVPDSELENPTRGLGGGDREGDAVLQGSGTGSGAKGGVYINSEWAYNVNGMYQIAPDRGWGFNVALNLTGHQGYPQPYFDSVNQGARHQNAARSIQVTPRPDSFRLEDVHIVDARIEKEFTFSDFGLTLGVDAFNLLNEAFVLQRQHRVDTVQRDYVREITSPRIFRIGARLSFR